MNLSLEIPDEIAAEFGNTADAVESRLKAELAATFYEVRVVSLGRASELSGLKRGDFEALLAQRRTVRDYSGDDLAQDMVWAKQD